MSAAIVNTAETVHHSLVKHAQSISRKFTRVFTEFTTCYKLYSGGSLSNEDISALGKSKNIFPIVIPTKLSHAEQDIATFLRTYRELFPNATVLPKMHILEDHVIPWLQRWKIGAGLMGEQGAESIHAHIAQLEQQYSSIANPLERIKYVYREHNLESAPELNSLQPQQRKYKKRSKD